MSDSSKLPVTANTWRSLRRFTDARIGLGRAGVSLPTSEMLAFQLAHARARDAVHFPLDIGQLIEDLQQHESITNLGQSLQLHSQAKDRFTYLQRPDLGRRLTDSSRNSLQTVAEAITQPDLALVIVDGLSSAAVQQHAAAFVDYFLQTKSASPRGKGWALAPLTLVEQGRVAIGDDIGQCLKARMVVVIIGERPGLSSPDSLGIYLTFNPATGMNDAQRNCISNVRPRGLGFAEASQRLMYLLAEADRLSLSGVGLKDRSEDIELEDQSRHGNFLIS